MTNISDKDTQASAEIRDRLEARRQAALDLLEKTGIMHSNYAPPYLRLCWRLGLDVSPPHFAPFWKNALYSGLFYALGWGILMYFFIWHKLNMLPGTMLGSALSAGFFFGLALASYYAYGKRKHSLPSWQDFVTDDVVKA